MIRWAKGAGILDGVRLHSISLLANVDPAKEMNRNVSQEFMKIVDKYV